jgi:hypothetical protein
MKKPMLLALKPMLLALALSWISVVEVSAPTTAFNANPEHWPGFGDEACAAQRTMWMEQFLAADLNTSLRADPELCGGRPDRLMLTTPCPSAGHVPPVLPTVFTASSAAAQAASLLSLIGEHAKDLCVLVVGLMLCCKFVAICVGRRKVAPPSPRSECRRADLGCIPVHVQAKQQAQQRAAYLKCCEGADRADAAAAADDPASRTSHARSCRRFVQTRVALGA